MPSATRSASRRARARRRASSAPRLGIRWSCSTARRPHSSRRPNNLHVPEPYIEVLEHRRTRMVKRLALLAAPAVWLVVAAVVVAAPSRPAPQVKHTVGFIESLALDGSVVAYDVQGEQPHGPACNRVYAWNIATRRVAKVSGAGTCGADNSSTGAGVSELAVAGSR